MDSLADQVIAELALRKGAWPTIAADNEVSYSWIEKLARNEIPDPGVRKIERLYRYLRETRQ